VPKLTARGPRGARPTGPAPSTWGRPLRGDGGADVSAPASPHELRGPGNAKDRDARHEGGPRFFERSILFLIKNGEARGLGGFGPAPKGLSLNLLAREVVIPLSEPSVFRDAVQTGRPFTGPLPDGKWTKHLMGKVGRFQSNSVALFPLVTHRESIAVLLGDNPETGGEFRRLEAWRCSSTRRGWRSRTPSSSARYRPFPEGPDRGSAEAEVLLG
jgi:hypothetical protein